MVLNSGVRTMSFLHLVYDLVSERWYKSRNYARHSTESIKQSLLDNKDAPTDYGTQFAISSESLDKVEKSGIKDIDGFSNSKGPNDLSIHDKLKDPAIKDKISEALMPSIDFQNAKTKYTAQIEEFNKLLKQVPQKNNPQDLIGTLKAINDEARNALIAQQKTEATSFSNALNKNSQFKNSFGLDADTCIKKLEEDLKKSHEKQLEEFDKASAENENTLHLKASEGMSTLAYISRLAKNNEEMRKFIEEIALKNEAKKHPNDTVTIGYDDSKISLSGVTMKDIKFIKTATGSTIHQQEDGSFTLSMSRRIFAWRYYLSPGQGPKTDFLEMAQAVKACRYKGITMELNYDDPETLQKRGRQAFEACIEAGFPIDQIKIMGKGNEMKPEDLYKDYPSKLQAYKQKALQIAEEYKKMEQEVQNTKPQLNKENVVELKKQIDLGVQKALDTEKQEIKNKI